LVSGADGAPDVTVAPAGRLTPAAPSQALTFALSAAGYPLVAVVGLAAGYPSRQISIGLRALIVALACWVCWRASVQGKWYRGAWLLPLAGFWTIYIGRLLADTAVFPATLGKAYSEYWLFGIGACFVPMLACLVLPSRATLRLAHRVTWVLMFAATSAVLLSNVLNPALQFQFAYDTGRFALENLDPISFGHLGVSLALLSAHGLVDRSRGIPRVLLVMGGLVGLLGTALSASRGPMISLVAGALVLAFVGFGAASGIRTLALIAGVSALVVWGGNVIERELGFRAVSRVASREGLLQDEAADYRVVAARDAWRQFADHPLLGSSLDERNSANYPHNVLLESFMAGGVFAGTLFALILGGVLLRGLQFARARPATAWIVLLLVQYVVAAQFSGALYTNALMWITIGLTLSSAASS
jgi:hypothetical protein